MQQAGASGSFAVHPERSGYSGRAPLRPNSVAAILSASEKGLTTGFAGLLGGITEQVAGKNPRGGLTMTGRYAATKTMVLSFGRRSGVTHGCGNLVPNSNSYNVEKSGERFLITVKSQPNPFVLTLGQTDVSPAWPHGCEGSDHHHRLSTGLYAGISKRGPVVGGACGGACG